MTARRLADALEARRRPGARPGAGRLGQGAEPRDVDGMWWLGTATRGERRARTRMVPQASVEPVPATPDAPADPPDLARVTAIIGGLGAAILWATATLASSRSSRMIGSRVVLAWVMIVGTIVGLPIALLIRRPDRCPARHRCRCSCSRASAIRPACASRTSADHRQGLDRRADRRDRGRGRRADRGRARRHDRRSRGAPARRSSPSASSCRSIEPARPDVPAGDIELAADALDGPARDDARARDRGPRRAPRRRCRATRGPSCRPSPAP